MEDNNDNTAAGEGGGSETNSLTKNKGNQNFFNLFFVFVSFFLSFFGCFCLSVLKLYTALTMSFL